jgi:hypothetical protein
MTFGYEGEGASAVSIGANEMYGAKFTSGAAGLATSIKVYAAKIFSNFNAKLVLVKHSDLTIVTNGVGSAVSIGALGWYESTFATPPAIEASTEYVLMMVVEAAGNIRYSAGDTDQAHDDYSNNYGTPTNPTDANHGTRKYSIYCIYTPTVFGKSQGYII